MRSKAYALTLSAGLALSVLSLPLAAATGPAAAIGDLHQTYVFAPTGESMSYRLYVPTGYDAKKPLPLVVLLHGAHGDENRAFGGPDGAALKKLADQHGFIMLAPRGYNPFGGYGNIYPVVVTRETAKAGESFGQQAAGGANGPTAPLAPQVRKEEAVGVDDYAEQSAAELTDSKTNALSEQEVFTAIADVRKTYNVDSTRIYLSGNSMGGVGTEYLAAKYPMTWAAVAPGGGPVAAWSYPFESLRNNKLPVLFVHGEFDEHSNPHWSSVLADAAKAEGVDVRFILVKGGHHNDAWSQTLPQIFDFFDAHHR